MVTIHGDGRITTAQDAAAASWMSRVYPDNRWKRMLWRTPLVLWRMGFGPLLGRYLMVVTATGRKSGLPRRAMVEYHEFDGKKVVPCAFGERAQWYRNITADPRVTIQTADGVEHVRARRISDPEELIASYEVMHRRNPVMLDAYLRMLGVRSNPEDVIAQRECIYWLTFEPTGEPTPPPLRADLRWVLPALAAGLILAWQLGSTFGREDQGT